VPGSDASCPIRYFNDLLLGLWIQRVNLFLQLYGSLDCRHHMTVSLDFLQVKSAFSTVLEPLLEHQVPADLVLPEFTGNRLEVLGLVDIDAVLFGFVAEALLSGSGDLPVPVALEPGQGRVQFF